MAEIGITSVQIAERNSARTFTLYIVVLILSGLLLGYLTWRVRKNDAAVQEATLEEARVEIAKADAKGDIAKKEAAAANQVAAEANERARKLEKDAEEARLETARLKAFVSWREITPENREKFKDFLKNEPKGSVTVVSVASNTEAANFGHQISEMLKYCGYDVSENLGSVMIIGSPPIGVKIMVKDKDSALSYGPPIQQALNAIGIAAPGEFNASLGDTVQIFVGNKP